MGLLLLHLGIGLVPIVFFKSVLMPACIFPAIFATQSYV